MRSVQDAAAQCVELDKARCPNGVRRCKKVESFDCKPGALLEKKVSECQSLRHERSGAYSPLVRLVLGTRALVCASNILMSEFKGGPQSGSSSCVLCEMAWIASVCTLCSLKR
jgi:hypothetical protein